MTQMNQPSGKHKSPLVRSAGKKPYSKPEFKYERVFETLALACGKIQDVQQQCQFNKKS